MTLISSENIIIASKHFCPSSFWEKVQYKSWQHIITSVWFDKSFNLNQFFSLQKFKPLTRSIIWIFHLVTLLALLKIKQLTLLWLWAFKFLFELMAQLPFYCSAFHYEKRQVLIFVSSNGESSASKKHHETSIIMQCIVYPINISDKSYALGKFNNIHAARCQKKNNKKKQ